MGDDILKIESKETMSREEAAARLHAIADGLASHNDVELDWDGKHIKVHVADEVRLELEIEVGEERDGVRDRAQVEPMRGMHDG